MLVMLPQCGPGLYTECIQQAPVEVRLISADGDVTTACTLIGIVEGRSPIQVVGLSAVIPGPHDALADDHVHE